MTVKIFSVAHLPSQELIQAWIQHMRNFDMAHPGCHFEIGVEGGPDEPLTKMVERMTVNPKLTFTKIFDKTKWVDADSFEFEEWEKQYMIKRGDISGTSDS